MKRNFNSDYYVIESSVVTKSYANICEEEECLLRVMSVDGTSL